MKNQSELFPITNQITTNSGKPARLVSGWKKLTKDRTVCSGPSKTVPNMAYEIKDLLTGYSRGIDLLNANIEGTYDDNPDHDQMDVSALGRMDITEQTQLIGSEINRSRESQAKIKVKLEEMKLKEEARKEPLSKIPPSPPTT